MKETDAARAAGATLAARPAPPRRRPHAGLEALAANLEQAIKGKPEALELAAIALLAGGHLLIEDVPGVGKTTLARALARSLDASFRRVQFTSDLLPSDILGVSVYEPGTREFEFRPGPIFAHVLLADEINRGTPKTQSALLEAMEEGQVSVEGRSLPLPRPFLVVATQNPLEHHGTFPLPESELDRFLLRTTIGYPDRAAERAILRSPDSSRLVEGLTPALSVAELLELRERVRAVSVSEPVEDYILGLVAASRRDARLSLGVSPRGAQGLYRACQARALLAGREHALPDDVKALAIPVLAHRVVAAASQPGASAADAGARAIRALLANLEVPL